MAEILPIAEQLGQIRLLWLIDSLTMGGAERLLVSFAHFVKKLDIDFSVCCLKTISGNPLQPELEQMGVHCVNLEARNLRDIRAFRALVRLIRTGNFDIIHAHLTYAGIWGTLAGHWTKTPNLTSLHVVPPSGGFSDRNVIRTRLLCFLLNRWSSGVITVSGALKDRYTEARLLDPGKVMVIHNGIDYTAFMKADDNRQQELKNEFRIPASAKVLVTVCVLRKAKGLEHLLNAASIIIKSDSHARFLIVGDGDQKQELISFADKKGLTPFIIWTGFRNDIPDILSIGDLFILPSLEEAFPTVLLEAMSSGLPVVSTDTGGIPEIIEHEKTGLMVPPGDPDKFAMTILELLGDADKKTELAKNAQKTVMEKFSIEHWSQSLCTVYSNLLSSSRKP